MVKLYNGETIFERQIRILSECGIKDFIADKENGLIYDIEKILEQK